MSKWRAEAKRK